MAFILCIKRVENIKPVVKEKNFNYTFKKIDYKVTQLKKVAYHRTEKEN